MKQKSGIWSFILIIGLSFGLLCRLFAQDGIHLTASQIDSLKSSCDSVSGPGEKVIGMGYGCWQSGSDGVMYRGAYPMDKRFKPLAPVYTSGSVVKDGLLPPIKPLLELHLRDTQICLGGDGYYYMTGSSGDNIWAYATGVELWRSKDLKSWDYLALVWSIEKDGTWEKRWQNLHGKPARALWVPEIHYIKGNYYICFSMPPTGISILKSTTGQPEGPYIKATIEIDKPSAKGIDPTFFRIATEKYIFPMVVATGLRL